MAGDAYDGRRLAPLNYTEQWIIGIKEWLLEFEKERVRVIPLLKSAAVWGEATRTWRAPWRSGPRGSRSGGRR